MKFRQRTLTEIADMICGNEGAGDHFVYRSSSKLTEFFKDCETNHVHDGSTRALWVRQALESIMQEPAVGPDTPPDAFQRVVSILMDPADALNEGPERLGALATLNASLARDGFEAFYAPDKQCYLKNLTTNTVATGTRNPHRPLSSAELERRDALAEYLDQASEDELIEDVLVPLFRHLGFHRVTPTGHSDKALEYGKDLWMKFTLPTQHVLYFGIQAKKGRIDTAGATKPGSANVAELHNQITMMLGYEIFDHDIGKKVLVDHAVIVAGGTITKAARNWLGNQLDASRRSQILFLDRDDLLNLYAVSGLRLPAGAPPPAPPWLTGNADIPF
jgi:hypothetical protein